VEFIPLYYREKLLMVNPFGFVGVVTLWSSPDWVFKKFQEAGVDLSPQTSPITAFGTLYGNGIRELLRNLLYNPQIRYLVICGRNRSGSLEDLVHFFHQGIEPVDVESLFYLDGKPLATYRIKGRARLLDGLVTPESFSPPPQLIVLENLDEQETIRKVFAELKPLPTKKIPERKNIPLPEAKITEFPCNPRSFVVAKDDIVSAWEELIFILYRFGKVVHLKKGERKELQNVKVVIEKPELTPSPKLKDYGFDLEKIKKYQEDLLCPDIPSDVSYSYGHRMRSYFKKDCLHIVIERLKNDEEDRKSYISLWDSYYDLTIDNPHSRPCLVTLFFRKYEGRLTLTAIFRTHNALDAWIYNVYGLVNILHYVAERAGIDPGPLTVISLSISIDVKEMARAAMIVKKSRHFQINIDPNGYFLISLDRDRQEIVVQHMSPDHFLITEYRGKKAEYLQHQLARDMAVSDINHAIYLGRQLAKAEIALKEGKEFVQE